jgi:uncharacterized protein (TIGR00255 family)
MALNSMTGFARAQAMVGGRLAVFEAKSVNSRNLDVRLRLPPALDRLETPIRQLAQARFKRGAISIGLTLQGAGSEPLAFSAAFLDEVVRLRAALAERMPLAPSTLEGLLSLKGASTGNATEPDEASVDAGLLAAAASALDALAAMRRAEGQGIREVIAGQLAAISTLADRAAADPSLTQDAIVARLKGQLALLGEAAPDLDRQRLHAEAALLATKADVREEIDRLRIHVRAIDALLASNEAQGRKLDFLAQELNREANTLCSKANAASLTMTGLDLKVVIDQFREQVQNVE